MFDGKRGVFLNLKRLFLVSFLFLLVGYAKSVVSAEGLWPNSAFSEPKQAQPITPPKQSAQLFFRDKQNRLQCYQKPNDEAFYVLSTGGKDFPVAKLSLYQLKPFELVKTVELPSLPMPFGRYEDAVILPVKGSNRVVIYNVKSLMLFDYEKEQIIKKRAFKNYSKGAVLKDGRVHVFFKNPVKQSHIAFRVYSADDLSKLDEHHYQGDTFGSNYRGNSYSWFSSLGENMVEIPRDMARNPQVIFYDNKTLKPRLIINHRDKNRDLMSTQTFYHVAPDLSKLYISSLYDFQSEYEFTSQYETKQRIGVDDNFHIEVDLVNKSINYDIANVPEDAVEMPLGHIYYQGLSESSRFVWIDGVFMIDKQERKIYQFHQFDDGEALIKDFNSDQIMTTENAIKHLKVKSNNGSERTLDNESLKQYQMVIE